MTNVIETNGAVIAVATSHARRRWRAIVLIGLVAGLVGGLVVASFTGARRTDTAYDRLVAASDFPDVFVQLIEPRTGLADDIDDLPSVERSVAVWAVASVPGWVLPSEPGSVSASLRLPWPESRLNQQSRWE